MSPHCPSAHLLSLLMGIWIPGSAAPVASQDPTRSMGQPTSDQKLLEAGYTIRTAGDRVKRKRKVRLPSEPLTAPSKTHGKLLPI